ncbi:MAG: T9SS type A sorting domain-containing protein [Bacteroidota bacterium]
MRTRIICYLAIYLFCTFSLSAQNTVLLKNIHSNHDEQEFWNIRDLVAAGDHLFFSGVKCNESPELYAIHVQDDSVFMLKNIWLDSDDNFCDYNPDYFCLGAAILSASEDNLFFSSGQWDDGSGLYLTDGTLDGTAPLNAPYPGGHPCTVSNFTHFNNRFWFTAHDADHGLELWVSDGTPDGTNLFLDILPGEEGSAPNRFAAVNDKLYFTTRMANATQIWESDGTVAGTQIIHTLDITAAEYLWFRYFDQVGDQVILAYQDHPQNTFYLGIIRPDSAQLILIDTLNAPGSIQYLAYDFVEYNSKVYFPAARADVGRELFYIDGSNNKPQLAIDLTPGSAPSYLENLRSINGNLFFTNKIDSTLFLYKSDGTFDGTYLIDSIRIQSVSSEEHFFEKDGLLYYFKNNLKELIATNGDSTQLAFSWGGLNSIHEITVHGDNIYFAGDDHSFDQYIFKWNDQMVSGPQTIIWPNDLDGNSGNYDFVKMNGHAYSWTWGNSGIEIWGTAGSEENTLQISDGLNLQNSSDQWPLFVARDSLLVFPYYQSGSPVRSWVSDGSFGSEKMLLNLKVDIREFSTDGAYVYFIAEGNSSGYNGLYITDGTETGTQLLKENIEGVKKWISLNGHYYAKCHYNNQTYLLKTDRTPAGTSLLTEARWLEDENLVAFKDSLFFFKMDDNNNWDLWKSDGTIKGTEIAVPLGQFGCDNPENLFVVNNKLIFWVTDPVYGHEPWVSDGTVHGTNILKDLNPAPERGIFRTIPIVFKDRLFFNLDTYEHGGELWVTDGTENGTHLFIDIMPGPTSSEPDLRDAVILDSLLFFSAFTEAFGYELWQTDGSVAETFMTDDICPGPCSSSPQNMFSLGDGRLLFRAYSTKVGMEPRIYIPAGYTTTNARFSTNKNNFIIYPNPTSGNEINIKLNEENNISTIRLINLNGQIIFEKNIAKTTGIINLKLDTFLSNGIYFIQFLNKEKIIIETKKVIVIN